MIRGCITRLLCLKPERLNKRRRNIENVFIPLNKYFFQIILLIISNRGFLLLQWKMLNLWHNSGDVFFAVSPKSSGLKTAGTVLILVRDWIFFSFPVINDLCRRLGRKSSSRQHKCAPSRPGAGVASWWVWSSATAYLCWGRREEHGSPRCLTASWNNGITKTGSVFLFYTFFSLHCLSSRQESGTGKCHVVNKAHRSRLNNNNVVFLCWLFFSCLFVTQHVWLHENPIFSQDL